MRQSKREKGTVSKARLFAVRALADFCESRKPLNLLVKDAMPQVPSRDQSLMAELVFGSVRWQIQSDWLLSHFVHGSQDDHPPVIQSILRSAIYQLRHLEHIPAYAVVHDAVAICRHFRQIKYARLVNAVLRNFLRKHSQIRLPDPADDPCLGLSVKYAFPEWFVRLVLAQYDDRLAPEILSNLNRRPWLTLRINTLKTTCQEYQKLLQEAGIAFTGGSYLAEFLNLTAYRGRVQNLPGYEAGLFSIQDESAGIVARVAHDPSAKVITDVCSAPGGKAAFLAELGGDRATILAIDLSETRLKLIQDNLARLGITRVGLIHGDGTQLPIGQSEQILLDAPCSGLGVVRKNPDIKIRRLPQDLEVVRKKQEQLLKESARALQPDGTLTYSTCTINREENEEMVLNFLRNHPEFSVVPIDKTFSGPSLSDRGWFNTATELSHLDGSFCVRLHKRKSNGS